MYTSDLDLVGLALENQTPPVCSYKRGKVLYWQGDPVENLYVIDKGAVKISSISGTGRIYSHGILGTGHLIGATDYFLDGIHETTAEICTEQTRLFTFTVKQFQNLINGNPNFSAIVMRELAKEAKVHLCKAQELSFLDVQQRLMHSLISLAGEHGLKTEEGVEIGVNITHEDIGEMINANRTTITLCLQELRKLGYIRNEGRRIILIPIEHMDLLDQLSEAILTGEMGEAADLASEAVKEGIDPVIVLNSLLNGMKRIDRKYTQRQLDINDIIWSSMHMKDALPVIETAIQKEGLKLNHLERIVLGTVQGDIHDIGKTVVSMLFRARGFEVVDLGVDVPARQFVEAVKKYRPGILAMSAFLTSTQCEMKKVIDKLNNMALRNGVKIMIGGASATSRLAREIGADGHAPDGRGGVELAWGWCSNPGN